MDFLSFLLFVFFTWMLVQALPYVRGISNKKKLPPGPVTLPIIGNLHRLGSKPHESLARLAKIYGPIMTVKLGQITTVVVSSPATAKEVLQKQDLAFSSRSIPDSARAEKHDQHSVAWLPVSPQWRNLRKLCNSHIFSTQKLDANQHLRRLKVEQLIAEVDEYCKAGAAVDIGRAVFRASLNLLSNTIFSMDLADQSSDMPRELKELVSNIMEEAGGKNLSDYFPLFRKLDPQGRRGRITIYMRKMFELFDLMIKPRLKADKGSSYSVNNDVLSTLLDIMKDDSQGIDRTYVDHLLLDLFFAGTDTTSNTVEWAMAEMLNNPKTLKKAQAELVEIVGKGKQIEESDMSRLPYLQAIVKETLRLHSVVPLLLPRKVEVDAEICGYKIPKGTQVLVNAWAIGRDENTWMNPNSFMPERFLNSDIDVRGRDFELLPFGGGRRICLGLPLAIRMIYLILGSLVNVFDWKLEDETRTGAMDMEDRFGMTLQKAQPLHAVPIHS